MPQVISKLALLLTLTTLISCTPAIEISQPSLFEGPPADFDESLCKIPKTQGDIADLGFLNLDDVRTSEFFAKKYDASDLQAVLTTSAEQTAVYVSALLNGRLYRVPRKRVEGQKVCPMFTELPKLPLELESTWVHAAGKFAKDTLAGLYFEACSTNCRDHELVRPTILIDESMNRWTLVHELMHHNFKKELKRDRDAIPTSQLHAEAVGRKEQVIRDYSSTQQAALYADFERLTSNVDWIVKNYLYATLVRTSLEELAVEGLLLQEYGAGRLRNVGAHQARNAVWYMSLSHQEAMKTFDQPAFDDGPSYRMLIEHIRVRAQENGWLDLVTKIEGTDAAIFELDATASAMIAKADALQKSDGGFLSKPSRADLKNHLQHIEQTPEMKLLRDFFSN